MSPRTLDARTVMARSVSEDDLLTAITDALTAYQYRWCHYRRSDKALLTGHPGLPDIVAARKGVVWFIELKAERNRLEAEQFAWFHALGWPDPPAVNLRVYFPSDLDKALEELR